MKHHDPRQQSPGLPLKDQWAAGHAWLGVWSTINDAIATEIAGRSGFDFVVTDLQHGYATMESSRTLLDALHDGPAASLVRVPWNHPELIMRALDLGADGVIVPMVGTGSDAQKAADACRYAPVGNRSWGPMRADTRGIHIEPGIDDRNDTCIVMIETDDGLANLAEIVRTPGVDAVYVGPNDLALSLGLGRAGYSESERLRTAIQTAIDTAHEAGILAGVDCPTPEATQHWRARGADFAIAASDARLLARAVGDAAVELRAAGTR